MPWLDLLFLLAAAYVLILVLAGIGQAIPWLLERLGIGREGASPEASLSGRVRRGKDARAGRGSGRLTIGLLRWTYRLSDSLSALGNLFARKDYTHWMSLALGETNLDKKVRYCSAALKRKPDCDSAWAIKANSLLRLKRYEEADDCFDRVLQLRPSATTWYEKGQCQYHLGRHAEAIRCFDESLKAYREPGQNFIDAVLCSRQLAEEAQREVAGTA